MRFLLSFISLLLFSALVGAQDLVPYNGYGFRGLDLTNELSTGGTTFLVTGFSKRANLYKSATGDLVQSYDTDRFAQFSKNDAYVISKAKNHLIKVFGVVSGEEVFRVDLPMGEEIVSYAIDDQSKHIAYASKKKTKGSLTVVKIITGEIVAKWDADCIAEEGQLAFSPDGKLIISACSRGRELRAYAISTQKDYLINKEEPGLYFEKFTMNWSSEKLYIISGSDAMNRYIIVYDLLSKKRLSKKKIKGPSGGTIKTVDLDKEEKNLLVYSDESTINKISISSGTIKESHPCSRLKCGPYLINGREIIPYAEEKAPAYSLTETGYYLQGIAFSPDSRFIMSGSYEGAAKVVDLEKGDVRNFYYRGKNTGEMTEIAMSYEGKYIGLTGIGGTLCLYDYETGRELFHWTDMGLYTHKIQFSKDNKYVAVQGNGAYIYELSSGKLVYKFTIEYPQGLAAGPVTQLAVDLGIESSDSAFVDFWTKNYFKNMQFLQQKTQQLNYSGWTHHCSEAGILFKKGNANNTGITHLRWQSESAMMTQIYPSRERGVLADINEDKIIIIAERELRLLDLETNKRIEQFDFPAISKDYYGYFALSPDGRFLLFGNHADDALLLYDLEKREEVFTIHYYRDERMQNQFAWVARNKNNEFTGSSKAAIEAYLKRIEKLQIQELDWSKENPQMLRVR